MNPSNDMLQFERVVNEIGSYLMKQQVGEPEEIRNLVSEIAVAYFKPEIMASFQPIQFACQYLTIVELTNMQLNIEPSLADSALGKKMANSYFRIYVPEVPLLPSTFVKESLMYNSEYGQVDATGSEVLRADNIR